MIHKSSWAVYAEHVMEVWLEIIEPVQEAVISGYNMIHKGMGKW